MIIPLYDTSTTLVSDRLVAARDAGGVAALGRVLTLLINTDVAHAEDAIKAANTASLEHPCRVIVLAPSDAHGTSTLDAEIRVGSDAGASEVVYLRPRGAMTEQLDSLVRPLLLADTPTVAWWPGSHPNNLAADPIGALAVRRIVDTAADCEPDAVLTELAAGYTSGDSDLAWTRLTLWRAELAAAMSIPPYLPVNQVIVRGPSSTTTALMMSWLSHALDAPVRRDSDPAGMAHGMTRVELQRDNGNNIVLDRKPGHSEATFTINHAEPRLVEVARRSIPELLAEELRHLEPDPLFGAVLAHHSFVTV